MNNNPMRELETVGCAYVPYPPELWSVVERAIASWKQFCGLDESARRQFPYDRETNMGVGYELKKEPGVHRDLKEDFHITLHSKGWLLDAAGKIKDPTTLQFVSDAAMLAEALQPTILDLAKNIEKEFDLPNFLEEVQESREALCFVRFLHYFGGSTAGDEIASPHADKSGFTLHVYESDPGLEYLDLQKRWQDMPVSKQETVVIPGMRLQYRSDGRLKAIYHRVVSTEKTARDGRFSIVCFVHLKNTPEYNKAKAGRLQEFPAGFNYTMPFEEFKELFI